MACLFGRQAIMPHAPSDLPIDPRKSNPLIRGRPIPLGIDAARPHGPMRRTGVDAAGSPPRRLSPRDKRGGGKREEKKGDEGCAVLRRGAFEAGSLRPRGIVEYRDGRAGRIAVRDVLCLPAFRKAGLGREDAPAHIGPAADLVAIGDVRHPPESAGKNARTHPPAAHRAGFRHQAGRVRPIARPRRPPAQKMREEADEARRRGQRGGRELEVRKIGAGLEHEAALAHSVFLFLLVDDFRPGDAAARLARRGRVGGRECVFHRLLVLSFRLFLFLADLVAAAFRGFGGVGHGGLLAGSWRTCCAGEGSPLRVPDGLG